MICKMMNGLRMEISGRGELDHLFTLMRDDLIRGRAKQKGTDFYEVYV